MPIGSPDDGRLESNRSGTMQSPAIDTARGAGFSLLDNLGRLVFYDNFNAGLSRWSVSSPGTFPYIQRRTDNLVTPQSANPFGFQSAAIPGPAIGTTTAIQTSLSVPASGNVGLEVGLRSDYGSTDGSILVASIRIANHTAPNIDWEFATSYDPAAAQLRLFRSGATWDPVGATFQRGFGGYKWWTHKIVVDPSAGSYKRLSYPLGIINLSGSGAPGAVFAAQAGEMIVSLYVVGKNVPRSTEMVGYVSVTVDEP